MAAQPALIADRFRVQAGDVQPGSPAPHQPVRSRYPGVATLQPARKFADIIPVQSKLSSSQPAPAAPALPTMHLATSQPPPIALKLARHLPIDMELPGEASPWAGARLGQTKWQQLRRWSLRSAVALVVLMITAGGLLFSQSFLKAHKVFKGGTATAAALKANVDPGLLKGEGSGRVNVLLLGRGGGNHDAPDLTDTMMLASIEPVNHTTALISIPRDLWINLPDVGVMKINAAWETGEFKYLGKTIAGSTDPQAIQAGFKEVDSAVGQVFGVTIDYNAIVDFKAFQQAVDTVGGVNITVPADLIDPTMAWENNNNPVLARAGAQVFNGAQALRYVRSRETSSDFARSQRQRGLLVALKDKVESLGTLSNPLKISGLLNAFGNNVSTDLSISNANRLFGIIKGVGDSSVSSIGLGDGTNQYVTTGNINGQSVVIPKAGLFNYADLQNYIRAQLKDPYLVREQAKVLVLNGTTVPGLAATKADELKAYGYNVIGSANTPNASWGRTTLIDLTHKNKYTKHYLEQHFGLTAAESLADKTIATNGADFVIIIGSDEATVTPTTAR